jgi:MFS transporter, DHA1 family, inner membrane transport protein
MAFLRNDAINRVNLHSGIQALAQGAGAIFFFVALLRAGVPIPLALLAQAAILAGRFVLRPAILPLAKRWGLKPLLICGVLGLALQYPVLAEVRGADSTLIGLCIVVSLAEVFYWVSYNAYFAAIGDAEHRGHQVSAREALVAVAGIAAPLLGAWSLVTFGSRWTFAAVAVVQALSVIPLLGAPNVAIKQSAPGSFRAARLGVALSAADGWWDASYIFVWQIALYFSLGESLTAYGGAMALAGLAGAIFGLVLGRHVDAGHGRRALVIASSAIALVVLLRATSLDWPWLAVTANALGSLAMPLLSPVIGGANYNLAKAAPCPLRFLIASEGGWDTGCFFACLCAAAIAAADAPLSFALSLALPGIAAQAFLLWRYYRRTS